MIIIPKKNTLIVTPPKCGSTSLHIMLCGEYGYRLDAFQLGEVDVGKHTTYIPYEAKRYKKLCLVRNPQDRFQSLYNHYRRYVREIDPQTYLDNFRSYFNFYNLKVSEICSMVRLDGLIRIEYLKQDIETHLGFTIGTVNEHVSPDSRPIKAPIDFLMWDIPNGHPFSNPYREEIRRETESRYVVLPSDD